jgi:HK97 family phage major capsid protein
MNATQSKLVEDLERKTQELDAVMGMTCADVQEEQARSAEVEKLVGEVDAIRGRLAVANQAADARAKAEAVRSAATASGVIVPAPAPAPAPAKRAALTLGNVRGFDTAEDAARAGRFLRALARGELRGDFTTPTEEPNAMGEASPLYDGRGSELVTNDVYRGVLNLLSYTSIATQVCSTYAVSGPGMYIPIAEMMDEAEFYLENCEIKPVTMGGSRALLDLKKMGARAQVSNELMEDAFVSVGQLVAAQFAYAFARKLDKTWLQGDTAAGILGLLGLIPAANVVSVPSTGLDAATLSRVVSVVNPNARGRAWVVSPAGWGQIMGVAAGAIGASIGDAVRPVVYGAPVYQSQDLPADTLAVYGDFGSACAIGYKPSGLQIRASVERAIEYDETVFVGTARYAWANHSPTYVAKLTAGAAPLAGGESTAPASRSAPAPTAPKSSK